MTAVAESGLQDLKLHRVVDYQAITDWDDGRNKFDISNLQIRGPWQYRGEGNSNIVLALSEGTQVIRLPKIKAGESFSPNGWIRDRKKLEREVIFANQVFGPIIGPEFVGAVNIVKINETQIAELNDCLKTLRPANRLHKELGVPFATSHADFARINNSDQYEHVDYCVEVKPKQGWWAKSVLKQPTNLCTFCLNQFLKLKLGKVATHSSYCPLNLFSGDPFRMIVAVFALLKTPQNNFRIFRNGVKVYGDNLCERESLESILNEWFTTCDQIGAKSESATLSERNIINFVFVLCMSLLKPLQLEMTETKNQRAFQTFATFEKQIKEILCNSLPKVLSMVLSYQNEGKSRKPCNEDHGGLPDGSILSRILYAQKLGKWGSGRVYNLYPLLCPHRLSSFGREDQSCPSRECLYIGEDKWLDEIKGLLKEVDILCIEHYLLAATAKDCSIMISFSPIKIQCKEINSKETIVDLFGGAHVIKVGVADLDPKPVTSIARHYVRDLEMNEAYRRLGLNVVEP